MNSLRRGRLLAAALGYLGGALPIVFLLGRAAGVDLRRFGTGNVGSHNLAAAAGPLVGLLGWLSDAGKGSGAVLLARRSSRDEVATGLALLGAMAGQCWPPSLRWQGGRGVATLVGGMLALTPRSAPRALVVIAAIAGTRPLGRRLGRSAPGNAGYAVPLGVLAGALAWPLACRWCREPPARVWTAAGAALLLVLRRVSADGWPAAPGRARRLLTRLLLDRERWRGAQPLVRKAGDELTCC